MSILIVLSCVLIVLVYCYLNRDKNYWRQREVIQFDGLLWNFITGNRSLAELYKEIYDKYPGEKYVGTFIGSRPNLILKDVDDINFVLHGDFHNFNNRGIVSNPNDKLADNLLFINDYQRWKLLRQKISPVFTHKKLKNMFYIMERCARDFVEFIKDNHQIRSKPFNALYTYTTASIAASVFGIDTHSKNTMDCPFMDMAWNIFEPNIFDNMKTALSQYSPMLFKMLNMTTFKKHEKFFISVIKKVLESRKRSKEVRYDFIDTCLELQQVGVLRDVVTGYEVIPTDEVLAAQAFFFFIAGADPTASTMNFTLLELSFNPDILKRTHNEIDKLFDSCGDTLTYEDLDKLVYLDMVINESMRKYPPIGTIQRVCVNPTVLPSGLRIEKDTVALIPILALHKDENYHSKPQLFDPERFAPDNVSNIVRNTFLPFGGGSRSCIGTRFARLQVKAGLALLLRRFTVREQCYQPLKFEPSFFSLRDPNATYELVLRNSC